MWWWVVGIISLAIFVLVLLSNIKVRVKYFRERENDEVDATISALFGLVRLRYKMPTIELKPWLRGIRADVSKEESSNLLPPLEFSREEMQTFVARGRVLIDHMKNYRMWLAGTMQHVHVVEFRWETRFGLGDAPETGIASGVVWSLKSVVVGMISRWVALDERPVMTVTPLFQNPKFRTDVLVRTKIKVFRIFAIVWMLMFRVLRKKGGWKVWFRVLRGALLHKRTVT
jgi:hypothetical protein